MPSLTGLKFAGSVLLAAGVLLVSDFCRVAVAQSGAGDPTLNAETFASIHKQIGPRPGESRWMKIPWLTDLHEARQKAAAEGKPLLLMVSGKGLSIGMC